MKQGTEEKNGVKLTVNQLRDAKNVYIWLNVPTSYIGDEDKLNFLWENEHEEVAKFISEKLNCSVSYASITKFYGKENIELCIKLDKNEMQALEVIIKQNLQITNIHLNGPDDPREPILKPNLNWQIYEFKSPSNPECSEKAS